MLKLKALSGIVLTFATIVVAAYGADLEGKRQEFGVHVQAYPKPGKIGVSVDLPALDITRGHTRLMATLRRCGTTRVCARKQIQDVTGGREELIFESSHLSPGRYAVRVEVYDATDQHVAEKGARFVWPGRSDDFQRINPMNNLVWQLVDVQDCNTVGQRARYRFRLPCDRWVFIRSTANVSRGGNVLLTLDSNASSQVVARHDGATGILPLEAMRHLKAGEHVIHLKRNGAAQLSHLTVRAIPEIQYGRYPTSLYHVPQSVSYDWIFLAEHILPSINTIIAPNLPENVLPQLEEWKRRGGKWLLYTGRPKFQAVPEAEMNAAACATYLAAITDLAHPLVDGIIIDNFSNQNDPSYKVYARAFEQLRLLPSLAQKSFGIYATGHFGRSADSLDLLHACTRGGGNICWEAHFGEWPTEKEARQNLQRYPEQSLLPLEGIVPGITHDLTWVFSSSSFPWPGADGYPSVDFKTYLDMQFQFVATHPAFFGLGGIQFWRAGLSNEEVVRFTGKLFRHYCIEGKRERLTTDPYELGHLQNPDFRNSVTGWTVSSAEGGSMRVRSLPRFAELQGRYYRGNDSFLWTRRCASKPNTFSQTIRNLTPGRLYSFKMLSGDHGDLSRGRSHKKTLGISVTLENAQLLTGPSHAYQMPVPSRQSVDKFTRDHPFWMNYHWQVFRANGTTARLVISDWANTSSPGPVGQELLYNFIEVKPYLEK